MSLSAINEKNFDARERNCDRITTIEKKSSVYRGFYVLKVIWEAEALIFQNSSGKFMNVVKSYICDNVFIEDLQIFADPVLICFANSAWETLCFENELIDWVSENLECASSADNY